MICRKSIFISVLLCGVSCSILENRENCPCITEVTVTRQDSSVLQKGRVEIYILNGSTTVAASGCGGLLDDDALLDMEIWPRLSYQIVGSSVPVTDGAVRAATGKEMDSLFTHRGHIDCSGEKAEYVVSYFLKQFTTLELRLSEPTLEYASRINLTVDSPYDGLLFPTLQAARGEFHCSKGFDGKGISTVRLPRQGGSGMTLTLSLDGNVNTRYDLFSRMLDENYNFYGENLKDMAVTVDLNHATGELYVNDWIPMEMGDRYF